MMWLLAPIVERFRALLSRKTMDAEVDEELLFHLEMETEKNLRSGLDPAEARRRAHIAFGGVERFKEQAREERGIRPLEDLVSDLRFSFRTLRKSPGFTFIALLSLALGIGANTAIFSAVNAILLRELPYEAPHRLVNLYRDRDRGSFDPLNYPDFLVVSEATREILPELGGYQMAMSQREVEEGVEPVVVEMVTGNYFPLLGVHPSLGRTILPEDHEAPGAHPVVMLGHRYWQTSFGGDPGVLGREVRLSGHSFTVVGVAPPEFLGSIRGMAPDLFAPIMMINEVMPGGGNPLVSRGANSFMPVGRLGESAALPELRVALENVAGELKETYPGIWDEGDGLRVVATQDVILNPEADTVVSVVNLLAIGVVGLVLLIACANLAGFLLARSVDRRKEIALRLSLGATRGRLIRQLLTETLVLSLLGGALGIPLALWILKLSFSMTLPLPIPLGLDLGLDRTVLSFTVAVALATGVLVGLVPALQTTRPELAPTLKDEGAAGKGSAAVAMGRLLVMGQMAMSVTLLVVAGLFLRSFDATTKLDPGFGQEPTAVLTFMIPAGEYPSAEGRLLLESILQEVRARPEVSQAAAISNIHLNPLNSMFLDVNVEGVPAPEGRSAHIVDFTSVSPGFFDAAGMELLEGRDFLLEDRADAPPVAVINQAMADRFWPGEDPLGRSIRVEIPGWADPTVVGVVSTAKIRSLGEDPTPFLYLPYSQVYNATVSVMAVTSDPQGTAGSLYRWLRETHSDLIVSGSRTLEDHIGVMFIFNRLTALLSGLFATMALGLALIGLYGVVSYSVARRGKEMGIRLSLGATPRDVVALQLREGLRLVFIGGGVGLVAAVAVSRALASLLVGVESFDPVTLGGAMGVLTVVASLAAFVPALRASRINPVRSLKSD